MSLIWVGERETVLKFDARISEQIQRYCPNFELLHEYLQSRGPRDPVIGVQLDIVNDESLAKLEQFRWLYPGIRFVIYAGKIESRVIRKNPHPERFLFLRPGEESDWARTVARFVRDPQSGSAFQRQRVFPREAINSPVSLEESEFFAGRDLEATSIEGTILDFSKLGMKILLPACKMNLLEVRFLRVKYWSRIQGRFQRISIEARVKWSTRDSRGTLLGLELVAAQAQ